MSEHVETSIEAGVLTLRLVRPDKKNAIDRAMYAAMTAALEGAEADDAVGAVLFAGVPGAFSAGNDIRDFMAVAAGGRAPAEIAAFLRRLAVFVKPMVAAVDGLAVGIGTTLLFHCDLVYASQGASFRTPFLDLGLVPEAGSSLLAPRIMGHQAAFALLVAGETFSAEEAREARFVRRVLPSDDVEPAARSAAHALAAKPREALAISRDLVRGPADELAARIELEMARFEERLRSPEAARAFAAFMSR
jgi:enoyl-CoA hydratase/carnithine racemase